MREEDERYFERIESRLDEAFDRAERAKGMGYDPDLVAECYDELVPNTLVEHEFTISAPDAAREVTAVRARTETLPPDVAKLWASFSDHFPIRQMPDRYSLPAVEPDGSTRGFRLLAD